MALGDHFVMHMNPDSQELQPTSTAGVAIFHHVWGLNWNDANSWELKSTRSFSHSYLIPELMWLKCWTWLGPFTGSPIHSHLCDLGFSEHGSWIPRGSILTDVTQRVVFKSKRQKLQDLTLGITKHCISWLTQSQAFPDSKTGDIEHTFCWEECQLMGGSV